MLGYADVPDDEPLSDFINRTIFPQDIPRLTAALEASAAENKEVAGQYRLRHMGGHWEQIALRHTVFQRDSAGKPLQFLCFAEDVAQKGQSEQANLDRLYILENARCLLWSANVYEIGDPQFLRWETQYPAEEAAQRFLPLPRPIWILSRTIRMRPATPARRRMCCTTGRQTAARSPRR